MQRTKSPLLPIADVSGLLGIPAPTLRSWERRYGFPSPPRTSGRHRRYSRDEIELLRALRDEIARGRSAKDAVEVVRRFGAERATGRDDVETFVQAAITMDPRTMQRLLNSTAKRDGVEHAITSFALPALREIGVRWESGRCRVGHEHLATEQIETWLQRQSAQRGTARPAVVIACGPDDVHRVGLDAFALLLARRHVPATVLGSQVPRDDFVGAIETTGARAAVVASHMKTTRRAAVASLRAAAARTDAQLFYGGNGFITTTARKGVPGRYLGEDLVAAADEVASRVAVAVG